MDEIRNIIVVAHLPPGLRDIWLEHLRAFDAAHPGCVFRIALEPPQYALDWLRDHEDQDHCRGTAMHPFDDRETWERFNTWLAREVPAEELEAVTGDINALLIAHPEYVELHSWAELRELGRGMGALGASHRFA